MFVALTRVHAKAVHHLLRNRLPDVPYSATWKDIHRAFELGQVERRRLHFTPQERELLRDEARRRFGWDLMNPLPNEDRIQAAAQAIDEKLAPRQPDEGFVLAKGVLPFMVAAPTLPNECALRVPVNHLDLAAICNVLVVENLDCFDQIHRFALPDRLNAALVLYRGHSALTRGTRQLLQGLPALVPVVVFADFDPAGLAIAATLPRASHVLIPQLTPDLLAKGSREDFHGQHKESKQLDSIELGGWQAIWEEMTQTGLSIKQQHLLAQGVPLRCIAR